MPHDVPALALHVAQAMTLPLVGLALGILARRALGPVQRSANVLWALSLVCAWIGLSCWPNPASAILDTAAGTAGLAHLVTDTSITGTFMLQFAFTCTVSDGWTPKRRGLVALYVALVGLYVAEWAVIHNGYSFYHGYSGWPFPVLATNLTLVALIGYAAGVGIYGYARYLRDDAHSSERMVAAGAITVFGLAGLYGLLVLGQTLAAALGLGSTEILGFTGPIMGVACSTALGVVWLLTGKWSRRLRAYAQAVFALRRREVEVEQRAREVAAREERLGELKGDIAILAVWVEDHLIQIHAEVDERPVADMATWSAATGQSAYQRMATLMTTRLTLLAQARVLRLPRYDLDLLPDEDEDQGQPDEDDVSMAENLPQEVEERENLLSDVLRLLQLVDPQPLPEGIEPREEPPGWRRDAATAITETLRRYGLDRRRRSA